MSVLAADVGGTSIRAAQVGDDGRILDRRSGRTPQDPDEGLALLDRFWRELDPEGPRALVIAGGIRAGTGEITQSPNLRRWEGVRPGEALGCAVLNDANGALLGEAWLGSLRGRSSAALLTLGTGVGGAVMVRGELWTGATGCAGEIGHAPVWPDGPECPCGGRGCLELYAGAVGIARAAGAEDAEDAAVRARAGEPGAREAFRRAGQALGIALSALANLLNPEAICLGGSVAKAFDLLKEPLVAELDVRAFRLARESLEIVPAKLGGDAGLLGAARLALRS